MTVQDPENPKSFGWQCTCIEVAADIRTFPAGVFLMVGYPRPTSGDILNTSVLHEGRNQ